MFFAFIPGLVLATASLRNLSADRDRNVLRRLRVDIGLVVLFVVLVLIVAASFLFGGAGYDTNNPPAAIFLRILLWTAAWAVGQVVALCGISAGSELLLRQVDRRVTT